MFVGGVYVLLGGVYVLPGGVYVRVGLALLSPPEPRGEGTKIGRLPYVVLPGFWSPPADLVPGLVGAVRFKNPEPVRSNPG